MSTAMDALAMTLLLVVSVWVVGFGTVGATLATRSGRRSSTGFALGAMFGPVGVIWLWWRSRSGGASSAHRSSPALNPTRMDL